MQLKEILNAIEKTQEGKAEACIRRFDFVAKPIGGLGRLEELIARIAAISGNENVDIGKRAVVVYCADNGVVRKNVAQGGQEITTAVAAMIGAQKASVSVMASYCNTDQFAVDIGMRDSVYGLIDEKLMPGTNDFTEEPAMTLEIATKAIMIGIDMVRELKQKGYNLIATGEAGIGNTTSSSAVCAALLGLDVKKVCGRGAGLDDAGLKRKIKAIESALQLHKPDSKDAMDILCKVGGLDIAAMVGLFIGGAYYKLPIIMDGFISAAAALIAVRLCPLVQQYIIASHESGEPGSAYILKELGLSPVIKAGLRLGEGTGAVALIPLLDMALAVYKDAATFDDIKVDQYKRMK